MASQDELQVSDGARDSAPADRNDSRKHRRARPSVDVQLAQDYKEQQHLPLIGQGVDPELNGEPEEFPSLGTDAEYVEIVLDKRLRIDLQTAQSWPDDRKSEVSEGGGPPRDYVTGRKLSDHGRSW